jgi:hypothetical protein
MDEEAAKDGQVRRPKQKVDELALDLLIPKEAARTPSTTGCPTTC